MDVVIVQRDDHPNHSSEPPSTTARSRRRKRGSGGISSVRSGVWRVEVELPRDPLTGSRRRPSRTVHGTRADAEVVLSKLRVADHLGRLRRPGTKARSVEAALDEYIAAIESGRIEQAPKTLVTTRSARNTMCDVVLVDGRRFGNIRLSTLSWDDVETMYRQLRKRCGAAWVRRCATVLSQGLERARKHDLIDHNPAKDAARPKMVRTKPHSPPKDELTAVVQLAEASDAELADAIVVFATTGMRLGEGLGLQWPEVDLDAATMHVAWAVSDGGPGVKVIRKATKRSDWRDVPLTDAAVRALTRQRERLRARFGVEPGAGHYVFPGGIGPDTAHRPDTFGDRLAAVRGDHPTTFQHLRHYTATTMLDAGEEYRTVADILGNSETTLRLHYDGRTNLDKRRAVSALEM